MGGAAATEVVEVVEQVVNEIPPIDPAVSFDTARGVVRQIHDVLSKLESSKRKQEADGGDVEEFPELARDLQLHMLSLRRAHRAMAKAADASRVAEAAARKAADEDHAELETRQYESACSRAEARRCRQFPAPELATLEPFLDPGPEEGENSDDELLGREPDAKGVLAPRRGLMARLESEHAERVRLATELAKQEAQKKEDLGALRAREQISADLAARLRIVDEALEPVCGLLELRSESDLGTPEILASMLLLRVFITPQVMDLLQKSLLVLRGLLQCQQCASTSRRRLAPTKQTLRHGCGSPHLVIIWWRLLGRVAPVVPCSIACGPTTTALDH